MLRRLISPALRNVTRRPLPRFLSGAVPSQSGDSPSTPPIPSTEQAAASLSAPVEADVGQIAADSLVELPVEELGYYPSHLVVYSVEFLHSTAGLPYWGAIVAIALGIRALMFPLAIMSARNVGKLQKAKPEIDRLKAKYEALMAERPNDPKVTVEYSKEMKALQKAYDLKPWQALGAVAIQLPVFISFFLGMQNVARFLDVTEGGFGWILDLSVPDASYALPVATAAMFFAQAEITAATQPRTGTIDPEVFKWLFRGIAGIMIPVTATYPSTVALYWSSGGLASVAQGLLLRNPSFRQAAAMPPLPKVEPKKQNPELSDTLNMMKKVTLAAAEERRKRRA